MKIYTNRKITSANDVIYRKLLNIAKECSPQIESRGNLKSRNNDYEDFIEISVWSIEEMLEKAYLLGKADGMK